MKTNIILDFNYLAHSEFSIFTGYGKNLGSNPLGDQRKEVEFVQGLASKFFYTLNSLPKGGKVVVCTDSKSWRKSVLDTYKSSREDKDGNKQQMDKATKDKFYELMSEFSSLLKDAGIIISRVSGAEGDDLLYRWSDYFYKNGENSIMVTGDGDMTQLVKGDKEPWIVSWNNNSKYNRIFVSPTWKDSWLKNRPNDIFEFTMSTDKDDMAKLIRDNDISILVANSDAVALHKILIGDDGDDVPSVWSFETKTKKGENKTVRVTEKKSVNIMADIKEKYNLSDVNILKMWGEPEFMEYLSGLILRVVGDLDGTAERQKVKENLERNAKLVWLTEETIPLNMISSIDEHISSLVNTTEAIRSKWNRNAIFEGTRFEMTGRAPSAKFDPFMGMALPE